MKSILIAIVTFASSAMAVDISVAEQSNRLKTANPIVITKAKARFITPETNDFTDPNAKMSPAIVSAEACVQSRIAGTELVRIPAHVVSLDGSESIEIMSNDRGCFLWTYKTSKLFLDVESAKTFAIRTDLGKVFMTVIINSAEDVETSREVIKKVLY